ncbi:gas vesicle protein [Halorubrum yunnanense]|uniref:Gas vesicle protein n=1 Tax=Halorubrum yunnanense TaxID=1526162 RepID=A0ABD5YHY6_9EURY|nr:gas vesicle protein [Halorubrum yunnanense]
MEPTKSPGQVVELVDVLLRDGAVLAADVIVTVAEVPLIGIQLRLALAGMTEMRQRGVFEEWDERLREQSGNGR